MDNHLDAALIRHNRFFDQLTDETVEEFRELASPNVRYRDPLTDTKGVDQVLVRMRKWFTDLDGLHFETKAMLEMGGSRMPIGE